MGSIGRWRLSAAVSLAGVVAWGATIVGVTTNSTPADATTSGAVTSANLLSGDEATFDSSTGGWSGEGTKLSEIASPVEAGTGALSMTVAVGAANSSSMSAAESPVMSAVPGDRYSATAYVQGATVPRSADGLLVFYDAAGNALTSAWGQAVTDEPGTWTPLPAVVGLAPANATSAVFAVAVYGAAAAEVHDIDTASVTGTTVSVPAVRGPLQTSGNQILDAAKAPVVLRGVNRNGTQSGSFPTDAEVGQMQAWGANVVRVLLNESLWLNTCTAKSPSNLASYPSSVDAEVKSITSRGMVALLDLHWNVAQPCGQAHQYNMADAKYAPTFWHQVASRYASNPLVAFDLYNEPHNITDSVWRNGGSTTDYYTGISYTATGMQQLYNTVRKTGATNLVFVTGQTWGNRPSSLPVSGTNIVNAVHAYTCPINPPPNCSNANPYDPSPILDNWLTTSQSSPVMVTEAGWPVSSDGTYDANIIADSESHGWGWIVFAWTGTGTTGFSILGSYGSTDEPNAAGMPVLQGLERN